MVLREFEKCGVISKHVHGPSNANWIHILYQVIVLCSFYIFQLAEDNKSLWSNSPLWRAIGYSLYVLQTAAWLIIPMFLLLWVSFLQFGLVFILMTIVDFFYCSSTRDKWCLFMSSVYWYIGHHEIGKVVIKFACQRVVYHHMVVCPLSLCCPHALNPHLTWIRDSATRHPFAIVFFV